MYSSFLNWQIVAASSVSLLARVMIHSVEVPDSVTWTLISQARLRSEMKLFDLISYPLRFSSLNAGSGLKGVFNIIPIFSKLALCRKSATSQSCSQFSPCLKFDAIISFREIIWSSCYQESKFLPISSMPSSCLFRCSRMIFS